MLPQKQPALESQSLLKLLESEHLHDYHLKIWRDPDFSHDASQALELERRKKFALYETTIDLDNVANYYSVPVMDWEIKRFLTTLPLNASVLDAGAGRCWQWRKIALERPDVKIFAIDFCAENFIHAKNFLGNLINRQIFLIHGDAARLKFPADSLDAYWSAGTLHHLPGEKFTQALHEAWRVLKPKGRFINYSFNTPLIHAWLGRLFGKRLHRSGWHEHFYLRYVDQSFIDDIAKVFPNLKTRYCEFFFYPGRFSKLSGRENSWLGQFDARLGNQWSLSRLAARQACQEATKELS